MKRVLIATLALGGAAACATMPSASAPSATEPSASAPMTPTTSTSTWVSQSMTEPPPREGPCGRACLEGYIDKYLDAMLENDVRDDLFARNARFTENGVELPLGNEGLWWGMSGMGDYKFYVPDLETQQIAFLGTVRENMRNGGVNDGEGNLVGVAIRLKIENEKITEIEQLAIRPEVQLGVGGGDDEDDAPGGFPPAGEAVNAMGAPHEIYFEAIPEDERASREDLIYDANWYFTGLSRNDGKGYYPFTDDCIRYENGIVTTRECKRQFEESLQGVISRVRDRRFVAVDRERGIVFAFAFFDHEQINWTWQLAELFKIENGQIRRIEAIFHQAPYGIPSGWSTYEQSISEEIQSVR